MVIRLLLDLQQPVTAARVARRLGYTARTFQRRLAERGTTFQDILRDTRIELVREHVGHDGMSITRLAGVLGLSEASAVSRFLKLNMGVTGKSLKAKARAERAASAKVARRPRPR